MARWPLAWLRSIASILLVALLGACGQGEHRPVELELANADFALPAITCNLQFNGIVDGRASSHLSQTTAHRYEIVNLLEYLDTQINQMLCCNDADATSELTVELRHAYSRAMATRGFYTVVLIVEADNETTVLRGRRDHVIWDGTGKEFVRGLKGASEEALVLLHEKLMESGQCQNQDTKPGQALTEGLPFS